MKATSFVLEQNDIHIGIYKKYIKESNGTGKLFFVMCQCTILFYMISPGVEANLSSTPFKVQNGTEFEIRPLPLSCWFPFNKYKHYYLSYTLTALTSAYGGYYAVATDSFFYALIIFCTGQISILKEQLREFKEKIKNGFADQETAIHAYLKECIEQHKVIIK